MNIKKETPITRLEIELARLHEFDEELKELISHDLRGPIATMDAYITEARKKLEEIKTNSNEISPEERIKQQEFIIRDYLGQIMSAGRRVVDATRILDLSSFDPQELIQESQEFYPLRKVNEIFDIWAHDATRKGKGLNLYYKKEERERKVKTNVGAFSTVFSNLIGNAIQYTNNQSNINAIISLNEGLRFEIENQISKVLNVEEINDLFKKGYRREPIKREERAKNEGFGLYFVSKVVRHGFSGDLKIRSDYKSRITPQIVRNFEEKEYSSNYPSQQGFPFFYARIKLPLEILV